MSINTALTIYRFKVNVVCPPLFRGRDINEDMISKSRTNHELRPHGLGI